MTFPQNLIHPHLITLMILGAALLFSNGCIDVIGRQGWEGGALVWGSYGTYWVPLYFVRLTTPDSLSSALSNAGQLDR